MPTFSASRPFRTTAAHRHAYKTPAPPASHREPKPSVVPIRAANLRGGYPRGATPLDEPAFARRAADLLTAQEAAQLLRVRRAWVYANARELGGRRLLGERRPWRFSYTVGSGRSAELT